MDEETVSVPKTGPDSTSAQIISLAVLEFGILLHSVFIGMTLAVNENFIILFIVIIFHRQLTPRISFRVCCLLNP